MIVGLVVTDVRPEYRAQWLAMWTKIACASRETFSCRRMHLMSDAQECAALRLLE
jgi:quinol monooxygenase YgiN